MNGSMSKSILCVAAAVAVSTASVVSAEPKISISVQETEMRDVLKFISEQSGAGIVISPDVSTKTLDINLQDVGLDEALDVILKPYGCGYRKVGKTVVVDKLENLDRLNAVEPLVATVITLKYLDAQGVSDIVTGLLSERGSVKVLRNMQQLGWAFGASGEEDNTGKLDRKTGDDKEEGAPSKTIIVSDTPSVVTRIRDVIDVLDIQPKQIEIRSFFVEFSNDASRDIGVQWGLNKDSGEYQSGGLTTSTNLISSVVNPASGTAFDSASQGMLFGLVRPSGYMDIAMQLSAMEEDEDVNVLSAPRIVTTENQEATILVGEKYPIITSKSDGDTGQITVTLDYFERIGIQLNVIPQICDNNQISMVIHPAVTSFEETVNATIIDTSGNSSQLATPFPRINTREAETRLTVDDGQTIAIGGLVNERDVDGVQKVPLLGDIPFVGRLFRRDLTTSVKTELVILMNASVVGDHSSVADHLNGRIDESSDNLINYWKAQEMDAAADMVNIDASLSLEE